MRTLGQNDLSGFCIFVTSTFGNGEPPGMASNLASWIDSILTKGDRTKTSKLDLDDIIEDGDEAKESVEEKKPFKRQNTLRRSKKKGTLHQRMSLRVNKDLEDLK